MASNPAIIDQLGGVAVLINIKKTGLKNGKLQSCLTMLKERRLWDAYAEAEFDKFRINITWAVLTGW